MQQGTWKLRPFRHVQTGAIVDIGAYGRCSERMFWAAFAECWVWKMPSVDDKDKFKESQCFWVDLKWPTWCGKWYIAQSQNIINLASSLRWTHVVDFRCRGAAALPLQDGPMDRWTDGPPATCSERRGHGACSATALDIIRETSTGAVEPAVPWSGETAIFWGSILGINTRITM